jgi:hypothetical protein
MNIPQTQGPNENYIILYYLSLISLSPLGGVRDALNFFCACLLSILSIYASKECYDMGVKNMHHEEEDMWMKLEPTSGKKNKPQKPKVTDEIVTNGKNQA